MRSADKCSQIDLSSYRKPSEKIMAILEKNVAYHTAISHDGLYIIHARIVLNPSLDVKSQPTKRLAGYEINVNTGISTDLTLYDYIYVTAKGSDEKLFGLNGDIRAFSWSTKSTRLLYVMGKHLFAFDIEAQTSQKINIELNMMDGNFFESIDDDRIIVRGIGKWNLCETAEGCGCDSLYNSQVPRVIAPITEENYSGKKIAKRTIPNLLKTRADQADFARMTQSVLYLCDLKNQTQKALTDPLQLKGFIVSYTGKYLMYEIYTEISSIVDPDGFGYVIHLRNLDDDSDLPICRIPKDEGELMIKDAVKNGPRDFSWFVQGQKDMILWLRANDNGDPRISVTHRDAVMIYDPEQKSPGLTGSSKSPDLIRASKVLIETARRCRGVHSDSDDNLWITESSQREKKTEVYYWDRKTSPSLFFSYESDDLHNNPGRFVTVEDQYAYPRIYISNQKVWMNHRGHGVSGVRPYVYSIDLNTKAKRTVWKSSSGAFQQPSRFICLYPNTISLLYSSETPIRSKRYHLYHIHDSHLPHIFHKNISQSHLPYFFLKQSETIIDHSIQYEDVIDCKKESIRYKRSDGLDLSATLYVPSNWKPSDGFRPVLIWAYPEEYQNKKITGQIRSSDLAFDYITWSSPLFWLAKGYIVVDDCDMPILTTEGAPFVEQLVQNAEAIISVLKERKITDGSRIAIGGHSFGSFMVANLLTHSKLFTTGIARSGAYNRTLTPFGFQFEDKYYWDVPETYNQISPFCHADKIETPILLIHGQADSNPGTFPIQSERYYEALRGLGKEAKLLLLPYEDHSYEASESIKHMLSVCEDWLDKWMVKS